MTPGFCFSKLRHKGSIQRRTLVSNGKGGKVESWATLAKASQVWAAIEPSGGERKVTQDEKQTERRYVLTIRARTDVTATMRYVTTTGRTFDIQHVGLPEESKWPGYMQLRAVERT